MRSLVPGGGTDPLLNAAETHRRSSRAAFEAVSTCSTLQREATNLARAGTYFPVAAVEWTTGVDAGGVQDAVGDRFDAASDLSERAEDRALTALVSTSQETARYAEALDNAVVQVCPVADAASPSDTEKRG